MGGCQIPAGTSRSPVRIVYKRCKTVFPNMFRARSSKSPKIQKTIRPVMIRFSWGTRSWRRTGGRYLPIARTSLWSIRVTSCLGSGITSWVLYVIWWSRSLAPPTPAWTGCLSTSIRRTGASSSSFLNTCRRRAKTVI